MTIYKSFVKGTLRWLKLTKVLLSVLVARIDTLTEESARSQIRTLTWVAQRCATRHPRGACGNAAWRLHYFWGEKCPFLLEDSSPRATRACLVKILRTAYKLDQKPFSCLPLLSFFSSSPSLLPLIFCLLYSSPYYIYNLSDCSGRGWEISVIICYMMRAISLS